MEIYKNILTKVLMLIFILSIMSISGCNNMKISKEIFPLDNDGYPMVNTVNINGINKKFVYNYGIDYDKVQNINIETKLYNELKIILPQGLPIHLWIADKKIDGITLVSTRKYLLDDEKSYDKEGQSAYLQEFVFQIDNSTKSQKLSFKKVNANYILNADGSINENVNYNDIDALLELNICIN